MAEVIEKRGMGWLADYPDFRDFTVEHAIVPLKLQAMGRKEHIKGMLKQAGVSAPVPKLPLSVDLRPWCSPIENQLSLGSCTAHAGVGLVEYFERRAFAKHIDASRLFLYKVTRNMLHWSGDTGAYLRNTAGALALFGVPPEEYWVYTDKRPSEAVMPAYHFDLEPPAFCYAFAQNYQAISYYRYDPPGTAKDVLLSRIKTNLAAYLPSMFGFTVYSSIYQGNTTGEIPYPTAGEAAIGGHAIDAVGYDDAKKIKNTNTGGVETKGAFLIRNSWGTGWGVSGYGWLPYDYVLKGLAVDWWSLIKVEWIETGQFKI
jgi:C1A family cysteine protease